MKQISLLAALAIVSAALAVDGGHSAPPSEPPVPLPALPTPHAGDRILVVAPHPDDETIGAGGYLMEAVKAGAEVRVVVATDGNKHGLKALRHEEIIRADGKLGIPSQNLIFFDYPDGRLSKQPTFQGRLEVVNAEFHPNIVIGTHPSDVHPDHAAVGRAIDAMGQISNHAFTAYFFVVHYPHYPLPDAFRPDLEEVPATNVPDPVSHWENLPLDPQAEQAKCAAVLEYHSQILRRNPLRRGLLISFIRKSEVFAVRSY